MDREIHLASDQPPATGVVYEFEGYRFEPGTSRLEYGNDTLHLPPKEMALLAVLVRNHGRVVTHRIIWDTLWPGQDVSYESITSCLYSLRRALGGNSGKMIKSVPRKGYTFTASTRTVMPALRVNSVIEKSIQTVPAAYSLYQQGLTQAGVPSYEHQKRAIDFFRRANDADPSYSVPLGAIAETSMYQSTRGYLSPADAARQASEAYDHALVIDSELVSAIAAKAWFEGMYHGNTQAAIRLFDHAQTLDPNHATTYLFRAWIERRACELHASLATLARGREVDGLNLSIANAMALTLFYLGRTDEALAMEHDYLLDRPEVDVGHLLMCIFYSWRGDHKEAIRAGERSVAIAPSDPNTQCALSYALARGGFTDKARKLADHSLAATRPRPSSIFLASSFLALGEEPIALSVLHEARERNCPWFTFAEFDPRFGSIREAPGFRALYDSN